MRAFTCSNTQPENSVSCRLRRRNRRACLPEQSWREMPSRTRYSRHTDSASCDWRPREATKSRDFATFKSMVRNSLRRSALGTSGPVEMKTWGRWIALLLAGNGPFSTIRSGTGADEGLGRAARGSVGRIASRGECAEIVEQVGYDLFFVDNPFVCRKGIGERRVPRRWRRTAE
jgi:hypothetical protein